LLWLLLGLGLLLGLLLSMQHQLMQVLLEGMHLREGP
jgi:hypothetical protein